MDDTFLIPTISKLSFYRMLFCSNFVLARDRCLLLELEEAFVEPDNEDSGAEVGNVAEDVTGAAAVAAGVFSLVVVVVIFVVGG